MAMRPGLRVLDAAQMVVDDLNRLLKHRELTNADQLREAAESITANIQEGYGRDRGPDRNRFLRFARGSAEETSERLRARFAAEDIPARVYWPLHHRLVAIIRMLTNLMGGKRLLTTHAFKAPLEYAFAVRRQSAILEHAFAVRPESAP